MVIIKLFCVICKRKRKRKKKKKRKEKKPFLYYTQTQLNNAIKPCRVNLK